MKRILITLMTLLIVVPLILGLALTAAAQVEPPPVEPPEVKADLEPGESKTVEKKVQTPEIPPLPDIYFMSDTTGSMGGAIAAVANNAATILDEIADLDETAQFGVGNYKDFPHDAYAFQHQLGITDDTDAITAVLVDWVAVGGADGPEGQFYALTKIATDPAIGWRDGSTKIVVWFGDAPAHDPVPDAATVLGYDITEATVIQSLQDAEIRVIAISLDTGLYYDDGLDDDPKDAGGDYATAYGITEDGTPGQASRIAAATDGVYLFTASPEEVVDAILEGLTNLPITVTPVVVEPCEFLEITFEPASQTVTSGDIAYFVETITVSADAPQCQWVCCTIQFVDEYGNILGEQEVCIHVLDVTAPEVWCVESVNPHGKNIPPAGKTTLPGPKGGQNEDGFYQLFAKDNCDPEPGIYIGTADDPMLFGSFTSGIVVKITEAPGATPSMKKMGSSNGKAGEVACHITLPSDPVITAVDKSGNSSACTCCLVPPFPK